MKTLISKYSTAVSTASMLVISTYGAYEYYYNMPKWFADPPVSFEVIRQQAKSSRKTWIPLQLLFLGSFVVAIVTNKDDKTIRTLLIPAAIFYLAIMVSTGTYFAKEIIAFSNITVDAPKTHELIQRTKTWYQTSMGRNLLQLATLAFLSFATYKKFKR